MIADITLFIVLINLHGNATLARAPPSSPPYAIYCLDRTCNFFHSPLRIPRSSSFRVSSLLLRCCCCCCYYFYYYYYCVQVSHDEYRLDIETVLVSTVYILFSFLFLFLFFFLFSSQRVSTLLYVIKCMESRFDAYFEPRRFFLPPRVCAKVL